MRLTSILFRNARQPQNEKKVPFKEILPLKLKSSVSGKNQRITGIFNFPTDGVYWLYSIIFFWSRE